MALTVADAAARIRANVACAVVGKEAVVDLLLVALLCEGHVLLEDVPGTGKTTLARAFTRSIGGEFRRVQFTPDLLPSDVTGLTFYNQRDAAFQFRPGPIFCSLLLADEINRATPRTQSALLEAMQERTVTIDGHTHPLPLPFMVVATQNPVELEGTFPLPEAQLDRFFLRALVGYPTAAEEEQIVVRYDGANPLAQLAAVITPDDVLALQRSVVAVGVTPVVRSYTVAVARATRGLADVQLGVSPRGSLALYRAGQALAAMHGRDFVRPDDVKQLAEPVLAHRLILTPEARLRGRTAGDVVREAVEAVAAPVE